MPDKLSDGALPRSLDRHRRHFLDELYRDHVGNLVGWLRRRYGGGPPSPEDIAQIVFTKLAALDDIQRIEKIKPYLYATAVNVVLDEIKWIKRTAAFTDQELHRTGQRVEEITPERVYQGREKLALLSQAMEGLSGKQCEIVRRSRFLGQTYSQISAETGWSSADISRQLSAAMIAIEAATDDRSTEDE